ncbi:sulfatase [Planctomyces sp. SH-PL14]|uniref:sulfatase family protein n=1 Tax=Planctomyces sp. SH-PL14 TaxID=1632864 RepID=UPI00078E9E94|nr:sulfatase-like hydrolase/transferase [Planctomyces sp. SH-PL14]AMV19887.1 Arylsulfatase [Planctomyces sp. SH-PL14]
MRFRWLAAMAILLSWSAATAVTTQAADKPARKPNILIFLADDLGYGELGCQGNPQIPTPHIDAIAKAGTRFTQGYVSGPYCSPTRAGLMTGRYQTRFGHEFNSVAQKSGLALTETTIATRLKSLGYQTSAVGKWHLGGGGMGGPEYRPMNRGFDEFFGTLANTPFYHPTQFIDSRVSPEVQKITDEEFYTTDKYAERAVDWLEKHKADPWFLYVPFNAQHAPLQAPKKYLDRFPEISDEKRKIFAAMLSSMDDAVGSVMKKVRDLGQEEETLVFYLADNGGPTASTTSQNGPLHGFKATTWEGGVRVPFMVQWKGKIPAGKTYDSPVIQLDILPTAIRAAGGEVAADWKLDGVDLLPYLTGTATGKPHETLYWRFGDQWAIRHGDHKLLVARGGTKSAELYNLAADIGESKDLAAAEPEKVKELQGLWDRWNAEQAEPSAPKEPPQQQQNRKQQRQQKKKAAADAAS